MEIYEKDGTFLYAREKADAIQQEINLCGYFVIIKSKKMTAGGVLELCKSRDASEKLFRGDKSYFGNRSLRVQLDEATSAKILIEFIALIVRCQMYTLLKEEVDRLEKTPNYMTVPAAIQELEKIEMVRQTDGRYRMDHVVTATQKTILKAIDIDVDYVHRKATELSEELIRYEEQEISEERNFHRRADRERKMHNINAR